MSEIGSKKKVNHEVPTFKKLTLPEQAAVMTLLSQVCTKGRERGVRICGRV